MKNACIVFIFKCLLISFFIVVVLVVAASAMAAEPEDEVGARARATEPHLRRKLLVYRANQKYYQAFNLLMDAIAKGDVDGVKTVLDRNHDVALLLLKTQNENKETPWDVLWRAHIDSFTYLKIWSYFMLCLQTY